MTSRHDKKPVILVVDDAAEQMNRGMVLRFGDRARVTVRHPSGIQSEDIEEAQLVLMDYRLEDWPERDSQCAAFNVRTGMALATIVRESADEASADRLTAVALHTGHLAEASGRIRPPYSRHVVARLNNLEWVFEKTDEERFDQIVELAKTAQHLDGVWPPDSNASEARAQELLRMDPEAEWFDRSWREVRECQPPIHQSAGHSQGVFFLRWLLHQVLPYPCFLWDINSVAARLRLHVEDLERLRASGCDLARDLQQFKYTGILEGFLGPRWWRVAIDDYIWELGGGSSGRSGEFEDQLREKAGEDLRLVGPHDPVVCLNRDFRPADVASPQDAVRVRPDYWPPFADAAWMAIDTVRSEEELAAMVEPLDQYRIETDG
ncbi:MAG: hypothetical protein OXN97_05930 [Bryobacterales bacterium]|nr:hypothetical protein [Bryobacterales bacterium]